MDQTQFSFLTESLKTEGTAGPNVFTVDNTLEGVESNGIRLLSLQRLSFLKLDQTFPPMLFKIDYYILRVNFLTKRVVFTFVHIGKY